MLKLLMLALVLGVHPVSLLHKAVLFLVMHKAVVLLIM